MSILESKRRRSLPSATVPHVAMPTALDDYEFDLRGFLVIAGALSAAELGALNDAYDRFPSLGHGEWYGNAQRRAC